MQQIRDNTTVIDRADNWNVLLFKEVYIIKAKRPSLNCGQRHRKSYSYFK